MNHRSCFLKHTQPCSGPTRNLSKNGDAPRRASVSKTRGQHRRAPPSHGKAWPRRRAHCRYSTNSISQNNTQYEVVRQHLTYAFLHLPFPACQLQRRSHTDLSMDSDPTAPCSRGNGASYFLDATKSMSKNGQAIFLRVLLHQRSQ